MKEEPIPLFAGQLYIAEPKDQYQGTRPEMKRIAVAEDMAHPTSDNDAT